MTEVSVLSESALICASRVFPTLLNSRVNTDIGLTQADALTFLEGAAERHRYAQTEVVLGCAFSALSRMHRTLRERGGVINWSKVRELLVQEFQNLRKNERAWNAYYQLFYELVSTYTAQWFVSIVLRKFCLYIRFAGSIRYTEDEIRSYLASTGLSADFESIAAFMERDDNFVMLPDAYRTRLVEQATRRIYDLTHDCGGHRGGPAELLDILCEVHTALLQLPTSATYDTMSVFYSPGDTSTNPIQANLDATIAGMLGDIASKTYAYDSTNDAK